ncbi:MAG: autotransporter outer membrane beta-barrel domain-containing protein [Planctomycetota bacterium]|jgi:outer membrane autotransporter protein|nr:autotransporter outer membrane beta-barrel domain-containing protein [Planctomycetota bacterium]
MKKILLSILFLGLLQFAGQATDFIFQTRPGGSDWIFASWLKRFSVLESGYGNRETKYRPAAIALGWERVKEQWSAGLTFSHEWGGLERGWRDNPAGRDNGWARIDDKAFGLTLFGNYYGEAGGFGKASLFGGHSRQKLKYGQAGGPSFPKLRGGGQAGSWRVGASLELGKRLELPRGFRLTPHLGLDYSRSQSQKIPYWENNVSGTMILPGQNRYEFPLGVTLAKDFVGGDWRITPSLDFTLIAAAGHLKSRNRGVHPGFLSRTGSEWKIYGIGASRWGQRLTAGIRAARAGRLELEGRCTLEHRKNHRDRRIEAVAGIGF